MSKFVFGYHGGGGAETTEDMDAVMAAWDRWYGEIGTALVDGGAPFGQLRTVSHDGAVAEGGGANPLSGYTIVEAPDIDAAVALAKGCPILTAGGSVEVAEAVDM